MSNWYTEIQPNEPLAQGQIIFNCPVFLLTSQEKIEYTSNDEDEIELEGEIVFKDVIVLTQACDLEQRKVDRVLLVEVGDSLSKKEAKEINTGKRPRYHLLNRKADGEITMGYKIVDFSAIYSLPLSYLEAQLSSLGKRLQLETPYIEYVSQRFGGFYSRIGLPNGISKEEIQEHHI